MRYRGVLLGAVAAASLIAGSALADGLGQRFSVGSNRGVNVLAHAHGTTKKPGALFVKVTSHPRRKIVGSYVDDCADGTSGGTRGGMLRGKTPVVTKLRHRFATPDGCSVSSSALLKGKGRITVGLYARSAG